MLAVESNPALQQWLEEATRGLSAGSAACVRAEIEQHYDCAREDALLHGAGEEEADRQAVTALGPADIANRDYREVLLTAQDARALCEARWSDRMLSVRPWVRLLWLLAPAAGAWAGVMKLTGGNLRVGALALLIAGGVAVRLLAPLMPIRTPQRGRVVRGLHWTWRLAVLLLLRGPNLLSIAGAVIWVLSWGWTEYRRMLLRRKLPVSEWPQPLFF